MLVFDGFGKVAASFQLAPAACLVRRAEKKKAAAEEAFIMAI